MPGGAFVQYSFGIIAFCMIMALVTIAMIAPWRYRLSRTSWRGIRFSFRGSLKEFAKFFLGGSLLTLVTLGMYYPIFQTKIFGFKMSHSCFGNRKFGFNGKGKDLLGSFLLAVLLFIPTFGLYWFWFRAKMKRYLWNHTSFGNARFHSTVTGGGLCMLFLTNGLLLIFSLGLAWSWVMVRSIKFHLSYLALKGPIDVHSIQQDAQSATAMGEGLENLMDLDTGFEAA